MSDLEQHPELVAYLDTVCRQIRSREVHAAIRQELMGHVLDRADALMATGLASDAALRAAIKQMGDPVTVGQELHRHTGPAWSGRCCWRSAHWRRWACWSCTR